MNNQTELEKMQAVQPASHAIGNFLQWAESHGMILTKRVEPTEATGYQFRVPTGMTINEILAMYFAIDLDKLEQEREEALHAERSKKI